MTATLDDCHATNQFLAIRENVMEKVSIYWNTEFLIYFFYLVSQLASRGRYFYFGSQQKYKQIVKNI